MKSLKIILIALSMITFGVMLSSCGNKAHSDHSHELQGKEYTSAYVCPMHCAGSGSDSAGSCPVCGMDYVANTDHKADGHKHEDDSHKNHDGDEHEDGDHDGHKH